MLKKEKENAVTMFQAQIAEKMAVKGVCGTSIVLTNSNVINSVN